MTSMHQPHYKQKQLKGTSNSVTLFTVPKECNHDSIKNNCISDDNNKSGQAKKNSKSD